ncbi:MAG: DUF1761 domain-containing protein [Pyrinomonadaceae bacterium]
MENMHINHIAVFVCAILSLVVGGLWWSPLLFAKPWQKEVGLSDDQLKQMNPAKVFGLTFVLAYLAAYNLAFFLGDPSTTWQWGIGAGLLAAFWAIAMFVIIGLFEQRTFKHMLINCGYIAVYFALIGFVLGIWR